MLGFKGGVFFFNVQYLFNLLCFVKHDEIHGVSDFFSSLKNANVSQVPAQRLWLPVKQFVCLLEPFGTDSACNPL